MRISSGSNSLKTLLEQMPKAFPLKWKGESDWVSNLVTEKTVSPMHTLLLLGECTLKIHCQLKYTMLCKELEIGVLKMLVSTHTLLHSLITPALMVP